MKHSSINLTADTKNTGKIGELIVSRYLEKRGHDVIGMNYRKKWGEIDVISKKGETIHFVEVKTVSRENLFLSEDSYSPEENVHPEKLKRMVRTIQSYLLEKGIEDVEWQIDVVGVFLDVSGKNARVRMTENVIV